MSEFHPTTFRGTDYEYKITLGTVGDEKSLSWHSRVYAKEWSDVERIVEAWHDSRDHPVVEVNAAYRPTDEHPNAE